MSKTVLERKNPDVPFVFISYSHKDETPIGKLLTALNENGADFWYDVNLHVADNWFETVKEVTARKNCVGIIYFMSPDFVAGDACLKEYKLYPELVKQHGNFNSCIVLLDDECPVDFDKFMKNVNIKLLSEGSIDMDVLLKNTLYYKQNFDSEKLYLKSSKDDLDSDSFVRTLFDDVFAKWGCSSEENGKIDTLVTDALIDGNYRLKTPSRTVVETVHGRDVEWKVFAYSGNTLSAILASAELYSATCRSLAKSEMLEINSNLNISLKDETDKTRISEKHLLLDPEFVQCLLPDKKGNVIRYLYAAEHEKYFMQLKEILGKVPITDATDDGYFFVMDNKNNILFADRSSDDVYRYINVDAYASIFPVIDIDLNKYREYVRKRNKA